MIRVTNLCKRFGDNEILKGISFDVPEKSILGVIGASGSGKTTLLRCLNGFETINGGTITCGKIRLETGITTADYKRRVRDLRLKVGTVFQHFYLFPHLSVVGNIIEAPVHVLRTAKKKAEKQAGAEAANSATASANQQVDNFKKAIGTCMTGRGYTFSK